MIGSAGSGETTNNFSFETNGAEMKQFFLHENAYNTYIRTNNGMCSNGFKLEIKAPRSLVGEGKTVNTATQVDEFLFKPGTLNTATVQGQGNLDVLNNALNKIGKFKITRE